MTPESSAPRRAASTAVAVDRRECLSALADGEAEALADGCRLWREDPEARAAWHAYQLIGDVMRSDELASSADRDAAFLARVRERLAQEPVPLAPTPAAGPTAGVRHLGWRAPVAVAAGFVAVAGVLVLTRGGLDTLMLGSPGAEPPAAAMASASAGGGAVAAGGVLVRAGNQIRDPQLDAYLRAHQAVRGTAAVALPGGALRNVDVVVPLGPLVPPGSDVGASSARGLPR